MKDINHEKWYRERELQVKDYNLLKSEVYYTPEVLQNKH